ncbi:MAG: hypothetical protein CM15mV10_1790 [uncultured marine virus]|nr:MAG: hypothetical protein CM15mV10_1790 [uncultured marine virus]
MKKYIKGVVLGNDVTVLGDLYFDCSGFNRILMQDALKVPWVEFNNKTYTDSAWAAQRPYKDKEKELKLYTNSVAMSSGWVWEIPHWNSIGTGYNYSGEHIDKYDALAEFKNILVLLQKRWSLNISRLGMV